MTHITNSNPIKATRSHGGSKLRRVVKSVQLCESLSKYPFNLTKHRVYSCHLTLYVLRASVTHKHVYYKLTAGNCDLQKCCYIFRLQPVVILRKPECTNTCTELSCDLPIVNGKTYITVTLLLNENVFCDSHCIKIIIQAGC